MCKCVNSDFAGVTLKKQVDLFRDKAPPIWWTGKAQISEKGQSLFVQPIFNG